MKNGNPLGFPHRRYFPESLRMRKGATISGDPFRLFFLALFLQLSSVVNGINLVVGSLGRLDFAIVHVNAELRPKL